VSLFYSYLYEWISIWRTILLALQTDHELTRSFSDQSLYLTDHIASPVDTKYAFHTCVTGGCISKSLVRYCGVRRDMPVRRRHATNANVHTECTRKCPGRCLLGMSDQSHARGMTQPIERLHLHWEHRWQIVCSVNECIVYGDATHGPEDHHSQTTVNQCFHIIYIPDAAMRIVSKEKAQNDLGFIPATLVRVGNTSLYRHLTGQHSRYIQKAKLNIQCVILKVIMQEWVSVSLIIMFRIFIYHFWFLAFLDDLYRKWSGWSKTKSALVLSLWCGRRSSTPWCTRKQFRVCWGVFLSGPRHRRGRHVYFISVSNSVHAYTHFVGLGLWQEYSIWFNDDQRPPGIWTICIRWAGVIAFASSRSCNTMRRNGNFPIIGYYRSGKD